jgi:type II secretory pathway component PulF
MAQPMARLTLMAQQIARLEAHPTRMAQRMAYPACVGVVVVGVVVGLDSRNRACLCVFFQ